jgi:hypothetical protein
VSRIIILLGVEWEMVAADSGLVRFTLVRFYIGKSDGDASDLRWYDSVSTVLQWALAHLQPRHVGGRDWSLSYLFSMLSVPLFEHRHRFVSSHQDPADSAQWIQIVHRASHPQSKVTLIH